MNASGSQIILFGRGRRGNRDQPKCARPTFTDVHRKSKRPLARVLRDAETGLNSGRPDLLSKTQKMPSDDSGDENNNHDVEEIFAILSDLKKRLEPFDPICAYFIRMCELALRETVRTKDTSH